MRDRKDTQEKDQWDVTSLYPSLDIWKQDFASAKDDKWNQITSFKGRLGESVAVFKQALELSLSLERKVETLYTYAHLRHDEEMTIDEHKSAYIQASHLAVELREMLAWFEPEVLSLPAEKLDAYLQDPSLEPYRFYIERLIHMRAHMLSEKEEELLAMAGKALNAPHQAFSALNNADIKFNNVIGAEGKSYELSHGLYQLYLRSPDRLLRQNAFLEVQARYKSNENTLAELISGQIESHVFNKKARNFKSSLSAALYPSNIPESVYTNLITTVRQGLPILHRYLDVRKKILNLKDIHLYDMYVPLVTQSDAHMEYDDAAQAVIESSAPLGEHYQTALKKGLLEERWVDRFENKNKRSGAYSSGCYDSHPFILMNYKGVLRDVFTLAHEAGHSMHSLLSKRAQPYHYFRYTIFVAEVASTFNEELLMHTMLKKIKNKHERAYLISEKLEDIRATFFRQTMFAEFELLCHAACEQGIPLTPQFLKEQYYNLNQDYFGKDVVVDKEIEIEWARIPHFYYNFYVYQYATGISAALYLAEKVLSGDAKTRDAYLNFLKLGGSKYPIDLLKDAGVDMTQPAVIIATLKKFDALLTELESLV